MGTKESLIQIIISFGIPIESHLFETTKGGFLYVVTLKHPSRIDTTLTEETNEYLTTKTLFRIMIDAAFLD